MDPTDGERLRSITTRYPYFQGLRLTAFGVPILVFGLLAPWREDFRLEVVMGPLIAVSAIWFWWVDRAYVARYGKVSLRPGRVLRDAVWALVPLVVLAVGSNPDVALPIATYLVGVGLYVLVIGRTGGGLRRYHWGIAGFLLVIGALTLPMSASAAAGVASVATGAGLSAWGMFEHRELEREIGELRPASGARGLTE